MFPRVGLFQAVELRTCYGGSLQQYISTEALQKLSAAAVQAMAGASTEEVVRQIRRLHDFAVLGCGTALKFFEDNFIDAFANRGHLSLSFDDAFDIWSAVNAVSQLSTNVPFLTAVYENNCGLNERKQFSPNDRVACDVHAGFAALRALAHHPENKTAAANAAIKFARLYAAEVEPVASSLTSITKAYHLELLRNQFSMMKDRNAIFVERNWRTYRNLGVFDAVRDWLCAEPVYLNASVEQQARLLQEAKVHCSTVVAEQCDYYLGVAVNNMLEAGVEAFVENQVDFIDFLNSVWIDDELREAILIELIQKFSGHPVTATLDAMLKPAQEPQNKRPCF